MKTPFRLLLAACFALATPVDAQELEPMVYTIRTPSPSSKTFDVNVIVPTEKHDSVMLMMPVWSPGMYVRQDYSKNLSSFTATALDGTPLTVTQPNASRWVVQTGGRSSIKVSYTLNAPRGSNLSNGVNDTSLVIVGPATFIALVEPPRRPLDLTLDLPASWQPAVTSLDAAPDGKPNHFVAPNYDILADSPILAGTRMSSASFTVGGATYTWAYLGDAAWDATRAVTSMMQPLVEEHRRFWGTLPFRKYVFLNIVTGRGGSGVEHLNSVAITGSGAEPADQTARFREAAFVSHEFFHAQNVKRLRPVELGPFDYETPPVTTGLWIAEGLTSYFGDLLAERAGLGSPEDYLATTSRHITSTQNSPGRLVQTLEQASSQMFERLPPEKRIDYYEKGPVVGLILDAHIAKMTRGAKSMDDVIKLEYKRWSGEHGYTAEQFARTASDAVGFDLEPLLHKLVATTEEIDYSEMLAWFGLRFAANADPAKSWTLEVDPSATPEQRAHFAALMASDK